MLTSPQSDERLKKAEDLLDEIKRTGSHHQINEKIDKYQHDFISPNDPGDENDGRESPSTMPNPIGSPQGASHNSRPLFELADEPEDLFYLPPGKAALDFIVQNNLAPEFQRHLDRNNIKFNIDAYYKKYDSATTR